MYVVHEFSSFQLNKIEINVGIVNVKRSNHLFSISVISLSFNPENNYVNVSLNLICNPQKIESIRMSL